MISTFGNAAMLQITIDAGTAIAITLLFGSALTLTVTLILVRRLSRALTQVRSPFSYRRISDREFVLRRAISDQRRIANLVPRDSKAEALKTAGPKSFFYLDEMEVNDLYPQVVREMGPSRIERRESREVSKGISADAPIIHIKPKYEKGSREEETRVYDIHPQRAMMYNEVEKYLLEQGKLTLGLEDFEYDESKIGEFRSLIGQMRDKFKVALPDSIERDFISDRMKEYAVQGLEGLAASSGYVFMLSDFSVENSDQGCVLSLIHPLSTYLKAEESKAIIRISCARDHMTALGKSTFTQGRLVKVSCLGKKVSWDPNTKVLDVIPFAIY